MSDLAAPAWCPRLLAEFDAADERASALARLLTVEQLNWRRDPAEWSVGQCLEHLRVVNEVYIPPILRALEGRPHAVVEEITPGWFGRWFIRAFIEPSAVTKKAKAPKKVAPIARVDATILDRFIASNRNARDLVNHASGYDVNRIRFKNPFFGPIRFTVGTGLEIVSRHQRRHLLQAERIRQSVQFPA